jgi:hypothetical protein
LRGNRKKPSLKWLIGHSRYSSAPKNFITQPCGMWMNTWLELPTINFRKFPTTKHNVSPRLRFFWIVHEIEGAQRNRNRSFLPIWTSDTPHELRIGSTGRLCSCGVPYGAVRWLSNRGVVVGEESNCSSSVQTGSGSRRFGDV